MQIVNFPFDLDHKSKLLEFTDNKMERLENAEEIQDISVIRNKQNVEASSRTHSPDTRNLVWKYFKKWQEKIQPKRKLTPESINKFVDDLIAQRSTKVHSIDHPREIRISGKISKNRVVLEKYENRYKAQRDIILMQKSKMLEQEQLIHELQYGKICEQLKTSYQDQRSAIKKLLSKLTIRTKIAAGVRIVPEPEEIEMKINKVPRAVWKMEERARERELKRQIIQERKRLIEEEKKRLLEEQLEKKRALDKEEKKRNLEGIKQRRKRELDEERRKQANREKFLENMRLAGEFYRKKLKAKVVKRFQLLLRMRDEQEHLSEMFYEAILIRKCLIEWRVYVKNNNLTKILQARNYYRTKLKRKYFNGFVLNRQISLQNMQVAMDYYDYYIQCKVLCKFYLVVKLIQTRRHQLLRIAHRHFNSKLLVQSFYRWKSFPALLRLERAKEERKRKWREKVIKILPDYKPQINSSF